MPRFKWFTSPLWRSRFLLLMLFFCVSTICSFSLFNELYSRPLHPVSALPLEPVAVSLIEPNAAAPETTVQPTPVVIFYPDTPHTTDNEHPITKLTGNVLPVNRHSLTDTGISDCIVILMMGVDSRTGGLVSRTDTMMLLKVCSEAQTVALLSIPRDLYVMIPGIGYDRINTALVHGAAADNENIVQGVALIMKTIQATFTVPVDHYILVDFRAVTKAIDALGGVDIYVPYTIDDPTFPDMNYGYDPLFIPEGAHHFDGEMALKYARTRHQDNDFYRARRQQQLLLALHQQALSLDLADLIQQAPALYTQVKHGVFTDLSLEQLVELARLADTINPENIVTDVLDDDYVRSYTNHAGERVLLLLPDETKALITTMFGTP